jgi:SSS family solute:Na+ symporter
VQFIGNVGYAYQHGLAVANWEWLNAPAILLLVFIFIPVYSRWKIVTMPQFLELRYNGRVRTVFAIITLLTYIFINMAGVIYSGGFVLNKILGLDLYVGIWTMAVVSGFFVVYGGMESIAWTNVLQAVLLLGSGLLVFVVGFAAVPGGWAEIIGTGDRSHLILPASHKEIRVRAWWCWPSPPTSGFSAPTRPSTSRRWGPKTSGTPRWGCCWRAS